MNEGPGMHPDQRGFMARADCGLVKLLAELTAGNRVHPTNAAAILMIALAREIGAHGRHVGRCAAADSFILELRELVKPETPDFPRYEVIARGLNRRVLDLVGVTQQ